MSFVVPSFFLLHPTYPILTRLQSQWLFCSPLDIPVFSHPCFGPSRILCLRCFLHYPVHSLQPVLTVYLFLFFSSYLKLLFVDHSLGKLVCTCLEFLAFSLTWTVSRGSIKFPLIEGPTFTLAFPMFPLPSCIGMLSNFHSGMQSCETSCVFCVSHLYRTQTSEFKVLFSKFIRTFLMQWMKWSTWASNE